MSCIKISGGKVIHSKITQKFYSGLEKGLMSTVNGIVVHQTDTSNAQQTFNSYNNGNNGSHFVIDKKGKIYQTAHVNQKVYHVGKIKSMCYETKTCSKAELKKIEGIYFKKGVSFAKRVKNLSDHEKAKSYPDRYLTNDDSIGIEIVGKYNNKAKSYEIVNADQNASLKWLIQQLSLELRLFEEDILRHPDVSRKTPDEASTANWK
jgi:N-acetyl-anhydromuramyl-L-alanine amidase AmpD